MSTIVWVEQNSRYQYAIIGKDGNDYVTALIAEGNGVFHWETCICAAPGFPNGWLVGAGESSDLEEARARAIYYGTEWIKGDSPIWSEK